MEVNQLYSFVLLIILVGMIIGVGVLTLEKFGQTTYYSRSDYNDTVTRPDNVTLAALDYGNVTMSGVYNGTAYDLISGSCYAVNATPGQVEFRNVTAACHELGNTWYAIYDYKEYDTKTKEATTDAYTELSNISTDWLGLIVTVAILSIILFLVIRSFTVGIGRR